MNNSGLHLKQLANVHICTLRIQWQQDIEYQANQRLEQYWDFIAALHDNVTDYHGRLYNNRKKTENSGAVKQDSLPPTSPASAVEQFSKYLDKRYQTEVYEFWSDEDRLRHLNAKSKIYLFEHDNHEYASSHQRSINEEDSVAEIKYHREKSNEIYSIVVKVEFNSRELTSRFCSRCERLLAKSTPTLISRWSISYNNQALASPENLFVGNISHRVPLSKLKQVFSEFGEVNTMKLLYSKSEMTNATNAMNASRSSSSSLPKSFVKGYAFVSFQLGSQASECMHKLNGKVIEGKKLFVNYHVERQERERVLKELNLPNSGRKFVLNSKAYSKTEQHDDRESHNKLLTRYPDLLGHKNTGNKTTERGNQPCNSRSVKPEVREVVSRKQFCNEDNSDEMNNKFETYPAKNDTYWDYSYPHNNAPIFMDGAWSIANVCECLQDGNSLMPPRISPENYAIPSMWSPCGPLPPVFMNYAAIPSGPVLCVVGPEPVTRGNISQVAPFNNLPGSHQYLKKRFGGPMIWRNVSSAGNESRYNHRNALQHRTLPIASPSQQASNIYVKNLPREWKDEDLHNLYAGFGPIISAKMITVGGRTKNCDNVPRADGTCQLTNPASNMSCPSVDENSRASVKTDNSLKSAGSSLGYGFVYFQWPQDAARAILYTDGLSLDKAHFLHASFAQRKASSSRSRRQSISAEHDSEGRD